MPAPDRTPRRRIMVAVLAAALLLAAACADDGSSDDLGAAPESDSVSDGSGPSAADAALRDVDDGSANGPDGAPGSVSPGTAGEPPAPTPTSEEYPPDPGTVPVGRLATYALRPAAGSRIVVEVRAQEGAAPRKETIAHIVGALRDASGKEIVTDGPRLLPGAGGDWTASALSGAADAAAVADQGGGQAVLRLLFVRGSFEGDSGVLGAAVRGDVAAVFSDQVDAAAGALIDPAVVEDAVTMHELGHLLGLVDLVLGTGRADPDHPGHSPNRGSVMYWQVESDLIGQLLGGGIPREFDADDRAELRAIRDS